jgi:integrase
MLYKKSRLHSTLKNGDFVKLATINRELELLRHMLNQADDILIRVPSFRGMMISKKQEYKRNRVLSHDEEMRLLAACDTADKQGRFKRLHVRPILICALDTAMRKGEILSLEWRDVDFDKKHPRREHENRRGTRSSDFYQIKSELESMCDDQRPAPSDKVFRRKILGRHAGKQVSAVHGHALAQGSGRSLLTDLLPRLSISVLSFSPRLSFSLCI